MPSRGVEAGLSGRDPVVLVAVVGGAGFDGEGRRDLMLRHRPCYRAASRSAPGAQADLGRSCVAGNAGRVAPSCHEALFHARVATRLVPVKLAWFRVAPRHPLTSRSHAKPWSAARRDRAHSRTVPTSGRRSKMIRTSHALWKSATASKPLKRKIWAATRASKRRRQWNKERQLTPKWTPATTLRSLLLRGIVIGGP